MDMNGDGVIDREEARDKFGDDPNFDQRYDEVDTNGDGVVDCGEHDAAVAAGPDGGPPHDGMEGEHDGMEGEHDGMEHMGPAPTNHWDGNCGAMMNGEDEYWLDSDGDGSPEDGPYAVWHEDADGNPVDCGPGPGDHDGGPKFEDVDTNGDGVIDREEARAVFGYDDQGNPDPEFDTGFDDVDQNGDGVVDPAEYEAAGDDDGNNN